MKKRKLKKPKMRIPLPQKLSGPMKQKKDKSKMTRIKITEENWDFF